jgi:branched-chain amino acid transport system substrate-binding protein
MKSVLVALAIVLLARTAAAAEPIRIPVILSLSGGAAFLGQGMRKSFDALADLVNKEGGINGRPVSLDYRDDESNPQTAVQIASAIIADHPPVILGPVLNATCSAVAPLLAAGPVDYCLSPAIHPAAGSFVFTASDDGFDQTAAGIRYFRMRGWTKLATLDNTDATGQSDYRDVDHAMTLPENAGVTLVARERFNPADVSVAAQLEKIRASGAQAIVTGMTGAAAGMVLRGMVQGGLNLPVSLLSGNESVAQLEQLKGFLPAGLVLTSAAFPEHDGITKLDPRVEKAQHDMFQLFREHGIDVDNSVATSWDAGLILVMALRNVGPTASAEQIRSYIAGLTDFAGIDGIYNFQAYPQRGLGSDSAIIVRYDPQTRGWIWLSHPGGAPLNQ